MTGATSTKYDINLMNSCKRAYSSFVVPFENLRANLFIYAADISAFALCGVAISSINRLENDRKGQYVDQEEERK